MGSMLASKVCLMAKSNTKKAKNEAFSGKTVLHMIKYRDSKEYNEYSDVYLIFT